MLGLSQEALMVFVVTQDELKIRLNDGSWVTRFHPEDSYNFWWDGAKISFSDVAKYSGRKPEYVKGLVDATRAMSRKNRLNRSRLEEIKNIVTATKSPLFSEIRKALARKYIT